MCDPSTLFISRVVSNPSLVVRKPSFRAVSSLPHRHTASKLELRLQPKLQSQGHALELGRAVYPDHPSPWRVRHPKAGCSSHCLSPGIIVVPPFQVSPTFMKRESRRTLLTCHCKQLAHAISILHLLPFCTLFQKHGPKLINGTR